jgi:hypothetical protein
MTKWILTVIMAYNTLGNLAQESFPRLIKQSIGTSGCQAYFPGTVATFDLSYSEDGAKIFTGELLTNGFGFGTITVQFANPITDRDGVVWDGLVDSYLNFLQQQMNITQSAGLGKGHSLESHPIAKGYLDYWTDVDNVQYVIKAWMDENYMGILYVYGDTNQLNFNIQELFLNGFRFPE